MGNLMSMRGGFLGQPISGGAIQREKEGWLAEGPGRAAPRGLVGCVSIAIALQQYNISTRYIEARISRREPNRGENPAEIRRECGARRRAAQSFEL